jgi:hypothetical protein
VHRREHCAQPDFLAVLNLPPLNATRGGVRSPKLRKTYRGLVLFRTKCFGERGVFAPLVNPK